jgi:hypothetical protein
MKAAVLEFLKGDSADAGLPVVGHEDRRTGVAK